MEHLLEHRLSALTTEINKIKEEIKCKTKENEGSFEEAWRRRDEKDVVDSLLAPPSGQYRPFESINRSLAGNKENISSFYWGNNGYGIDDGPLDLTQLKNKDDGNFEKADCDSNIDLALKELLECVEDAVSIKDSNDMDNLDDLLNLVTKAIEPAFAIKCDASLDGQHEKLQHQPNKSQRQIDTDPISPKRWSNSNRATYNTYQVPRLQFNPIDEEGDTLLESAARSIQNKYLHISPEDQSSYQTDIDHVIKDENDLSLASMEYLKRHRLSSHPPNHFNPPSSRNNESSLSHQKRITNPGNTSRFLDLEKLGRLKKLT